MNNQNNINIELLSRVAKTKMTKLRNREIKALKKSSKENEELKAELKKLIIEKNQYIKKNKELTKEKLTYKQNEEKYNFYNKFPTKKSRDERMNKLLNNLHPVAFPTATKREHRNAFERKALNDSFVEKTMYDVKMDDFINVLKRGITEQFLKNDHSKYTLYCNIAIEYIMFNHDDEEDKRTMYFNSESERTTSLNQINEFAENTEDKFVEHYNNPKNGSNFVFEGISYIKVQTMRRNKTRAGSFIPLPDKISNKKACININNKDDDKCILYCMLAHKYVNDEKVQANKSRSSTYAKFIEAKEIKEPENQIYPIEILKDIPKFEKLNDIKINVFEYDEKYENLNIIYNTRKRNENTINILNMVQGDKNHLVYIKDISKLLRLPNDNNNKKYWCIQCLSKAFDSVEDLEKHHEICFNHESIRCVLPHKYVEGETILNHKGVEVIRKQEDVIKFTNYQNEFKHPFHILMDFEATLEPINNDPSIIKNTIKTQKHIANSCGIKYSCIHEQYSEPIILINENTQYKVMEKVINEIERLAKKSYDLTQQNKKHCLKADTTIIKCQECNVSFNDKNKAVIHHDHITGEYISTICNQCNLRYQYRKFIPVYVHNLRGYDSHFIIPALNSFGYKQESSKNISCIPCNEEKYISFSKMIKVDEYTYKGKQIDIMYEIRFLDSMSFMMSSIDKLTLNIKSECKTTEELRKAFKNTSEHFKDDVQFNLMTSKGVYPYEYIDSYDKLLECKLPPIQNFYSKLTDSHCTQEDYKKAVTVWKAFNCKTILDYHNIYLTSDVLLLNDIWDNFRTTCFNIYKLDANYYYTAPGLSWDAFLKHTNQEHRMKYNKDFELQLITDIDIYQLVENSIRGGLSQISKRYAKANNKYIPETYDKNEIDEYILYLDANNLYGGAMISYLPKGGFKWNLDNWTDEKVIQLKPDSKIGYLFEVDIEYPESLHDLHNGYALGAENITIPNSYLNGWQQKDRLDGKIEKLCTSFNKKINYGINYRLLKLYIELGLIITYKRVLEFEQDNFMEAYIMKNTNERKNAKNDFEKDFFKLMNNSVYGKTMENVRNRINFKLVSTEKEALACRNKSAKYTIFNDNLVGVHLLRAEVKLNKPIYIGQAVLDQSKHIMQDFHYNFMLKQYEKKDIDVCMTDTDSLCYHLKNKDPYEIIANNKFYFDLSEYPKNHKLYDPTN